MNDRDRRNSPRVTRSICGLMDDGQTCCLIVNSINDGVFVVSRDRRIEGFFNQAAERLTGFRVEEAVGRACYDVLRCSLCQTECPVDLVFQKGEVVRDRPAKIISRDHREVPVCISLSPIKDDRERVIAAVEVVRDCSVEEDLRRVLHDSYHFGEVVSKNPLMQEILELLPVVAESHSTVLIQGESGTGKSMLARIIHQLSSRRAGPFVKLNCGAIPDPLLESELFGYRKGAFTDARKDKPGRLQAADGGTLFLDEVGCMSAALQVKLLRFLEERAYVPLGGTEPVFADVRIVAASNVDLEQQVAAGSFRADLFYRLNVIGLRLPTLAERREDIPLLARHILRKYNAVSGKNIRCFSEQALSLLMNYDFPGNVRELENIVEHACVLCPGPTIEVKHLPMDLVTKVRGRRRERPEPSPLASSEERTIRWVLRKVQGSRVKAAHELGISRATLWRKMKRYGIS
ncbi:PAS domain S-box-containing protein [Desulfacinum hydrothermale DSM 13146]|uniref:PAS domain S-box-containing protein n=1 Tax=Desulfacinum hydrothermale DSM 13146 TaxID=1121390 RepID=A0A1W1XJ29_9BACT|nr:sigma 54-interacting transcriptional regulator [Desulfacinum hydrothermale]SMC23983.1 PAS domain S-box-containing protein [Desulfacinum hydrothermale DSM 13146]